MLFVFGNSHVVTFCGSPPAGNKSPKIMTNKPQRNPENPNICSMFLGKGLVAYNFVNKHLPKVYAALKDVSADKSKDSCLLYIGEVDCRYYLAKRVLEGDDRETVVKECVERFFETVKDMLEKGWRVAVAGSHPTTTEGHDEHPDHPHWGDCALRNAVCVEWNKQLKALCDGANVPFICIYDELVDENNITKMEYFVDYCHLSYEKCFPKFLRELRKAWLVP